MELTEEQKVVAYDCWAASRAGLGVVVEDTYIPAAHALKRQAGLTCGSSSATTTSAGGGR